MDLNFSPDDQAFRVEVRAFLRDQLPSSLRVKVRQGVHLIRDDHLLWQRTLYARGWSAAQQYIFDDECAAAGAPEQQHFLQRIQAAEDWWCQGYSEPGSDSDLASVKTRAVLDAGMSSFVSAELAKSVLPELTAAKVIVADYGLDADLFTAVPELANAL